MSILIIIIQLLVMILLVTLLIYINYINKNIHVIHNEILNLITYFNEMYIEFNELKDVHIKRNLRENNNIIDVKESNNNITNDLNKIINEQDKILKKLNSIMYIDKDINLINKRPRNTKRNKINKSNTNTNENNNVNTK